MEESYRGNCMVDCTSTKNCCTLCLSYAMARSAIKRTPKIQVVKPISHNTSQKRKYQLLFRSSRNLFVWNKKSSFLAFRLAFMLRQMKNTKVPASTNLPSTFPILLSLKFLELHNLRYEEDVLGGSPLLIISSSPPTSLLIRPPRPSNHNTNEGWRRQILRICASRFWINVPC